MAQPNLPAVTAIVVAAGASRRMGFDKLSYRLPDGRTVLETSCTALAAPVSLYTSPSPRD